MGFIRDIFFYPIKFLLAFILHYEHPKAEIPQGLEQRIKVFLLHHFLNFGLGLAKVLDKAGLCYEHDVLRFLVDGIPPQKTNKLLIKNVMFNNLTVRIYQPKVPSAGLRRGIVYCHGGVGRFGSINAYERVCRYICRNSDSVVASVEYRLAPEHPFPAQFDDCLAATIHFMRTAEDYGVDPSRVIVCGDSSGGTIAATVCQALVDRTDLPKVRGQILIYPFLQAADFNLPSYQQNEDAPVLLKSRTLDFGFKYLNLDLSLIDDLLRGAHIPESLRQKYSKWLSPDNLPKEFKTRGYKSPQLAPCKEEVYALAQSFIGATFSPLLAEDAIIRQLPDSFILTCEYDVLRDDGLLYKKRLEDNGVRVTWCHLSDGFHGVLFAVDYGILSFKAGCRGIDRTVNFIKTL
ncbi:arylacetamide deacetylase-like 4 [Alligator mississippiensis]|uniref:Arylacetamide deacetylase-like 3 n=1 Tax=Alligator mississippiensis TaxID=8496 RepID=A0A151PIT2_ALLMI|nr:arylacetamide deacetylase-like 4 [Alligator mississippiensis]KYO48958.1 arylacetamide deacetylase-like 3 [Alligator mississippiensis]